MGRAGIAARTRRWACGGSLIRALCAPAAAEAAPSLLKLGDFTQPVYATGAPGDPDRVFVVERAGRVKLGSQTFLDLSADVATDGSERGLLSLAFAPDYATSGRFFVYLTAAGTGDIQIREYRRATADTADPVSARRRLRRGDDRRGGLAQPVAVLVRAGRPDRDRRRRQLRP